MKPKISMVTLGVDDLGRALAFYRDGLGWPTHNHADGDDFIMFPLEGAWLALYSRAALATAVGASLESVGPAAMSLAHNVSSEAEVEAVYRHALAAGAASVTPPRKAHWGGYEAGFADPDGFLWDIAYNPFTDLT